MEPGAASVAGWVAEARSRWGLVGFGEAEFAAHLERLKRAAPEFPIDSYLAAACAAGDPAAIRVLDEELIARVPRMIRRIDPDDAFTTEVCQRLRVRLLVSEDGSPPRIARYTGDVPLAAWVRVIALRLALNAKRQPRAVDGEGDAAAPAIVDPELDYLRASYKKPFERALEEALATLPKDDRTVLRLHYVDGANIESIGRIFQVHRATVARWLVRIRSDVLTRAKALMAEQLGAEIEEADSVLAALAGEVDVTLSRVLGA